MQRIRAIADIAGLVAHAGWSLLRHPHRPTHRSLTTEWSFRLAKRLLTEALDHDDAWLRRRQALLRVPGPALSRVRFRSLTLAGVRCVECQPRRRSAGLMADILYLHGGGYVVGSADAYRYTLALLADLCGARVLAVDYRLAPEHPVPAAQQDCGAVLQQCMRNTRVPLFLMGDSAGGALVLSTWMRMSAAQRKHCAGLVLLSPWLAPGEGASLLNEAAANDFISAHLLARWALAADPDGTCTEYLRFVDAGALPDAPPVLVQSGALEIMRPQIQRFVENMREAGGAITWQEYPDQFHVFQTLAPLVREAVPALRDVAGWMREMIVEIKPSNSGV